MARREFPKDVYAQIVRRAMLPTGEIACEGCGLILGKKPYHVDHTIPDALFLDKKRKLTADDGKLLGVKCCHAPKTKQDVKDIAEAKRREAKNLGFKTRVKVKIPSPLKPPKPAPKAMPPRRSLYQEISHHD
ncbi:MAG: hypothetical protein ACTHJQ_12545 [Rhizobiaceae bacterium]